jgi:hypothetical protein
MQGGKYLTLALVRSTRGRRLFTLVGVAVVLGCGPKTYVLRAQRPETCTAEYRFTTVLSGNTLGVTLSKDFPADREDELVAVLSYKQVEGSDTEFHLVPPLDLGDTEQIQDQPPPMAAHVEGERACLGPMSAGDGAGDACLASWLEVEHCYQLLAE